MSDDQNHTTHAIRKLLTSIDEVIAMATELQKQGRPGDALAYALCAAEYIRAARALQNMEDASHA